MTVLLLIIIYMAFISLGLPDSLLGAAWPVVHEQFGVPLSYAGIVSTIISVGTIVSSLSSERLTRRFGAGPVTACSVLTTAIALLGFAYSRSFAVMCLWAVPYGLGAGAVDAALNHYVATHFKARHMSWLHCFWGVGCTVSPYIMGWCLTNGFGWTRGYGSVGVIQVVLAAVIFASLPLWMRKTQTGAENGSTGGETVGLRAALKIRGVKLVLLAFFAYCALETTTGLWASSFLVEHRGVAEETAARFASLFYIGITVGRFLSGCVSEKLGDKALIRTGAVIILLGVALTALPLAGDAAALAGLVVIGFGCAPVYPSIIHATPQSFGEENSQAIIGVQMASAYCGSTLMPPLFGLLTRSAGVGFFPLYLAVFAALILILTEAVNRAVAGKTAA